MGIELAKPQVEKVDLFEYITTMLAVYGVKPQHGKRWMRFPAVWRGSNDYNIAANVNGVVFDHTAQRRIPLDELMTLLGDTPDASRLGRAFLSRDEIENSNAAKLRRAKSKWNDAIPLSTPCPAGDACIQYLLNRGIPESVIERNKPYIRASMSEGLMMLTPIFSPVDKSLLGVQRYYIDEAGSKRIPEWEINEDGKNITVQGEKAKMMMGFALHGGMAGGVLIHGDRERFTGRSIGCCEGYETGLAIMAATGMPMYVLYTAGGLERMSLNYLASLGVEEITICGDNDLPDRKGVRRGQQAVGVLADRIINEIGIMPKAAIPEVSGTDWLNAWNADPAQMIDRILNAPGYDVMNLVSDEPDPSAVTLAPMLARRYRKS